MKHKHDGPAANLGYVQYMFTSLLYMLQKAPISEIPRSKSPKTQQVEDFMHARKTSDVFVDTDWDVTLAHPNNIAWLGSLTKVLPFL